MSPGPRVPGVTLASLRSLSLAAVRMGDTLTHTGQQWGENVDIPRHLYTPPSLSSPLFSEIREKQQEKVVGGDGNVCGRFQLPRPFLHESDWLHTLIPRGQTALPPPAHKIREIIGGLKDDDHGGHHHA